MAPGQLFGVKPTVGEDSNPDHDSMDENFEVLDTKSSLRYNKRPPSGSYEVFSLAELMQPGNEPVKHLGKARIHCSGASFLKASPCGTIICLYGKSGFEILKVKIKTRSKVPYADSQRERETTELAALVLKSSMMVNEEKPLIVAQPPPTLVAAPIPGRFHNHQDDMRVRSVSSPIKKRKFAAPPVFVQSVAVGFEHDTWEVPDLSVKLITLRFRWKPRYKISYEQAVEISPQMKESKDGKETSLQWVAIAFDNNHSFLYKIINNGPLMSAQLLTREPKSEKFPFLFKFIFEPSTDKSDGEMFMSYTDRPTKGNGESYIYIYSVEQRLVLKKLYVRSELVPFYLDFGFPPKKNNSESKLTVKHHMKLRSLAEIESEFHMGYLLNESHRDQSSIAFANIIFRNLQDYLETEDPKTESASLQLLKNCFNSLSPFEFYEDPRLMLMVFVLNQPGFFKEALANVKIENLISTNHLLELLFSSLNPTRNNSEIDVAELYMDCVQLRKVHPVIPNEWIRQMILELNLDGLTGTMGSKRILSMILLSPTAQTVRGLTSHRDISLIPFPESEAFQEEIPSDLLLKKVDCLLVNNPVQTNDYHVYRTRIPLELTNGSDFSIGFFQALQKLPDSELQYKYKQLINYKWRMVYFHSLVYTLVFLFLNVMAYLYFGYIGNTWMGIVVLILNLLFIAIDVKMFGSNLLVFSKNLNSWIDIIVHTVSAVACIITLFNLVQNVNVNLYIKVIAIIVVSIRGIIQMKVFSGIRILIMLIGQIIIDLAWVPVVLAVIFILAGSIYSLVPLPDGSRNSDLSFYEAMRQTFILLFLPTTDYAGSVETNSQGKFIRSLITVVAGSMFIQGIFNFVIAIFLQTFRKVNDNKDVYELRSLLIEITDYDLMLRFLTKFMSRKVEHHFLVLVPVPKDGVVYENETRFDRLNNIKDSVMVEMGKKSMDLMGEQAKKLLPGKEEEIDKLVKLGQENAKPTDPRIAKLAKMLDKVASYGAAPDMSDLKNIADIMCDGLDDEARSVVKRTQLAVEQASSVLAGFSTGVEPSLEELFDLIIAMAGALDPYDKRELVPKLDRLKHTVIDSIELVDQMQNGRAVELPLAIRSAFSVAQALANGAMKNKLSAVGKALGVIAEEAALLQEGGAMNIGRVIQNSSDALSELGAGVLQEHMKSKSVTVLAAIVSEFLKNARRLQDGGYKDPETLLKIGGEISQAVLPESKATQLFASSEKILRCVKDFQRLGEGSLANSKLELTTTLIASAGAIVEEIYPEAISAITVIKDLCTSIESASKSLQQNQRIVIGDMASAISPLVSRHLGEQGKKAVEGIVATIKLVEDHAKVLAQDMDGKSLAQDSLKRLPEMLEGASKLIKIFVKDDQKVQQALDVAIMSARLVQNRLETSNSLSNTSETIFETTIIAIDVMSTISPKIKASSATFKKTILLLKRQFQNLSKNSDQIDLESLLTDLGTLVITANKDWADFVSKTTDITRVILTQAKEIDTGNGLIEMQYLKAGCNVLNKVSPKTSQVTNIVLKLATIGERIGGNRGRSGIAHLQIFGLTEEIAEEMDPWVAKYLRDGRQIFKFIEQATKREPQVTSYATLKQSICNFAAMVEVIDPSSKLAAQQASDFAISLLTWIEVAGQQGEGAFLSLDVEELLSPLCNIIEKLKPEVATAAAKFKQVASTLQKGLLVYRGSSSDSKTAVIELISSVGNVIQEIDNRYSAPVGKVTKLAGVIHNAVLEYENPSINGMHSLLVRVGDLLSDCDPTLQPRVNQILALLKLIANEIQNASPGDPGQLVKDSQNGVNTLFMCLKSVLTHYEPKFLPYLDKIHLVVSSLAIQLEEYQRNGKISLDSCVLTANTIIRELAPDLQEPCQILQCCISTMSSTIMAVRSENYSLRRLDWETITSGITELARICNYEHTEFIRVIGSNIRDILEQFEFVAAQIQSPGFAFQFSGLFSAIIKCVKRLHPNLEPYFAAASISITNLESLIMDQRRSNQFDPLKIMACAVKILCETSQTYNTELTAFSSIFQIIQEQVKEFRTGDNMSVTDGASLFRRIGEAIAPVLETYSPKSMPAHAAVMKATNLVLGKLYSNTLMTRPSEFPFLYKQTNLKS